MAERDPLTLIYLTKGAVANDDLLQKAVERFEGGGQLEFLAQLDHYAKLTDEFYEKHQDKDIFDVFHYDISEPAGAFVTLYTSNAPGCMPTDEDFVFYLEELVCINEASPSP